MNPADTPTATTPPQHTQEQILSNYRSQLEAIEADYAELLRERFLLTGLSPNTNVIDAPPISIPSQQQVASAVSELMKGAISTNKHPSPRNHSSFLRPERRHQTRPPDSILATWASNVNEEEQSVVMKDDPAISQIQHESSTLRKVLSLRQRGLWEPTRLPKVWEPPRLKTHWDFLLEEMTWLAADFDYERKFRSASLRRISRAVDRYHHEKESAEKLRANQEQAAIRRRASAMAKQVHNFWSQMLKIVEWKEHIIDDHVKRYNLHSQLTDLLSQTENYSHKIRMGVQSTNCEVINDQSSSNESDSEPSGEEEEEIRALQKEADLSLEDLVDSLPPDYIKKLLHNHHSISSEPNRSSPSLSRPLLKEAEQELGNRELSSAAEAAQHLQPSGNTLSTTNVSTPVPPLLKGGQLREYQHIGLNWLSMLHSQGLNGFLADEMGLGKTIQTIALLSHLACQEGSWGPHLIIVPTSVILNWEYEFKKWCPAFKLVTYYGNAKVRRNKRAGWTKQNAFHVCITSYQLAVADQVCLKGRIEWDYIILDEAQNIKNYRSQRWQALLTFKSRRRLLLSGTPLQNNIMELWALMHFLMPDLFSSHSDFKEWFSKPLMEIVEGNQTQRDRVVERLHRILRPFLLRRLKCEVEVQLPKKIEHVIPCHLSKRQKFLYEDYMSLSETRDKIKSGGALNLLNILMQLRKVCNHPDLFELRPILSPLVIDPIQILLPSLLFLHALSQGFVSGVTMDKFELIQRAGLDLISEVTTSLTAFGSFRANSLSVEREGFSPDTFPLAYAPLPPYPSSQTNGLLLGENTLQLLRSYNKESDRQLQLHANRLEYMFSVSSARLNRPLFYGADLIDSLTLRAPDPASSLPGAFSHLTDPLSENNCYTIATFSLYIPSVGSQTPRLVTTSALDTPWCYETTVEQCYARKFLSECIGSRWDRFSSYEKLQFPETRLVQFDCGKLQILDQLLYQLKTEGHRVIVFTQMSRMLNILEVFLNYHGYKYFRLDGSTSPEDRFYLVERFNNDKSIFVFILSTRSGGIGMNLTGADTVIFYDIDWNPTMDAQAQDRCHRIGQTKNVHIYRLICEGTIEVNILKKSQQKKLLGELAIEKGHFTTSFFETSEFEKGLSEIAGKIGEDGNNLSTLLFEVEEDTDAKFAKHATTEAKISEENDILEQSDRDPSGSSLLPISLRAEIESDFLSLQEELNSIENFALLYLERNLHNLPFKYSPSNIFSLLARESEQTQNHFLGYSPAGYYFDSPLESPLSSIPPSRALTPTSDSDLDQTRGLFDSMSHEALDNELDPSSDSIFYVDPFVSSLYNTTQELIFTGKKEPVVFLSEEQMSVYKVSAPQLTSIYTPDTELISSSNLNRKSLVRKNKELPQINNLFVAIRSEEDKQRMKKKLKTRLINEPLKKSPTISPEHFGRSPWLLPSEWRLCHCVLNHLEAPLGLVSLSPSQELNWSFVSEYLTSVHSEIRVPSECYEHYLHVIFRDKGIDSDIQIQTKHKEKIKRVRARVEQITDSYVKDNNCTVTSLSSNKFRAILDIAKRRKPPQTHEPISPLPYQSHLTLLQNLNISPSSSHAAPLLFAQNKLKSEKRSGTNLPSTPVPVLDPITPLAPHAGKFTFQAPFPPTPTPPYPYTPTTPINTSYLSSSSYSMGPWDTRQAPTTPGIYSSLPAYPAARTMRQGQNPYMSSPAKPQPDEMMDTSQLQMGTKYIQNYPNYYPKRYTNSEAYSPLPDTITPITPLQHQQMPTTFFPKVPVPLPQHPNYSAMARAPTHPQPSCSHMYMGPNSPYPPHQNSAPAYNAHSALNAYSPTPHTPLNTYSHHTNSNTFNMNTNSNIYHTNSYSPMPATPLLNETVPNDLSLPPSNTFYPPHSGLNSSGSTIK